MSADDLISQLESCTLPEQQFHHFVQVLQARNPSLRLGAQGVSHARSILNSTAREPKIAEPSQAQLLRLTRSRARWQFGEVKPVLHHNPNFFDVTIQ